MTLARRSGEQRRHLADLAKTAKERERLGDCLRESKARVDDDARAEHPGRLGAIDRHAQIVPDEPDHAVRVGVPFRVRPRTRPAVRDDEPCPRSRDGLRDKIVGEPGDVIGDRRARLKARLDDRRARRVDRDRDAHRFPQAANRFDRAP